MKDLGVTGGQMAEFPVTSLMECGSGFLCFSPNIIRVIKSRRMRWVRHVARMGELHTGFRWGDLMEGDRLEDADIDGRIILNWILRKWDRAWTGLIWLRIGTGGGLL
jgi:hypothetical protein